MDIYGAEFEILDNEPGARDRGGAFSFSRLWDLYGRIGGVSVSGVLNDVLTILAPDAEVFLAAVRAVEDASAGNRRRQMFFMRAGTPNGKKAMRDYFHGRTMSVFQGVDGVA